MFYIYNNKYISVELKSLRPHLIFLFLSTSENIFAFAHQSERAGILYITSVLLQTKLLFCDSMFSYTI